MITILDGNAFYLRITGKTKVGEYEATLCLEAIDSLIVNFVRRVRESQTVTHDQGKVLAYNDGKLAKGVYGVEMVGYYNGQPWRFYAPEVFEIADDGETEASNVIGSVNVYDVTFYMKLGGDGVTPGYVDAAVTMHNTSEEAHTDMREAITGIRTQVERRLVGAKVTFNDGHTEDVELGFNDQGEVILLLPKETFGKIDGVKVNGEELEVDENGKVDITIPQNVTDLEDADNYATKEDAQAMVDEAKIRTASANTDNSVGTPRVVPTINGQNIHFDIYGIKGEKGNDGNTVILNPQGEGTPQNPDKYTLYSELGGNTDGAMTQKAFSDIIGYNLLSNTYTFNNPGGIISIGYFGNLSIPAGTKLRFSVSGLGQVISGWQLTFNNNSSYKWLHAKDYVEMVAPTNITVINFQVPLANIKDNAGTVVCSVDKPGVSNVVGDIAELKEFKDEASQDLESLGTLNTYHDAISEQLNMQKIVPEVTWSEGKIGLGGKLVSASTALYSSPIEVKRNDIVYIKSYANDTTTQMASWVVNDGKLYDNILLYTAANQFKEYTFRAKQDGYISVCRKNSTNAATINIFRGIDESTDAVMPNILRVPKTALQASNGNLFNPINAKNYYYPSNASAGISYATDKWMTGFIELPPNVNYIRWNYMATGNYNALYDADGNILTRFNGWSPREINLTTYPAAKYIRLGFDSTKLPFAERYKLMVTGFWQETNYKPYATLDPNYIGIRDVGIFQLSDVATYAAEMVFGTYVDATTFNVDSEPLETLSQYKAYIDNTTRTLYRWDGEALSKACMWTDRGVVFTKSFYFSIPKTWHKENMIVTASAKWVGTTAPTIRFIAAVDVGHNNNRCYTMPYIIGAKDNYSTKEWRPYNLLIHQEKTIVEVKIPSGTTLMVDEFTNYYSNRKERGTFPQFHFRSGNGLNQGLTAWEEAAKLGYEYIIVIPKRTADGKWVIFHDDGNINGMYREDGTSVSGSSPIGNYTYEELLQYDIANGLPWSGNKLPLLEDFFAMCAKRGIHPCFSVHPNFSTQEWEEVRELSDKWGVTKHLNIKAGFMRPVIANCYSVFGDNVESYMTDMNTAQGQTERNTNPSVVVNETLGWSVNIDKTKVRVGIEYFPAYATSTWISAAVEAGLSVGVVTSNPAADGTDGNTAADILNWIGMGVSSFTDLINPSVGLNW